MPYSAERCSSCKTSVNLAKAVLCKLINADMVGINHKPDFDIGKIGAKPQSLKNLLTGFRWQSANGGINNLLMSLGIEFCTDDFAGSINSEFGDNAA
jgi:hypothetical protein